MGGEPPSIYARKKHMQKEAEPSGQADATPDWFPQVVDELDRLSGSMAHKKRNTIIELVKAGLDGRSAESVFKMSHTCSRNTYHKAKSGWKHDKLFMSVHDNVNAIARSWVDGAAARSIQLAAERLALYSPLAVTKAAEAMAKSGDWNIIVRAAFGILDRADIKTAMKGQFDPTPKPGGGTAGLSMMDYGDMSDEELAQLAQQSAAALAMLNQVEDDES